jgi:tetratricopeptide (TPR) repeat protein
MWNYRKNLQIASENTRYSSSLFVLIVSLLLWNCGPKIILNPPKTPLQNPAVDTPLARTPDFNEGYEAYRKGDQQKARQEFKNVLRKNPDHYAAYLALGYTYIAENDLDHAERYIRTALDKNPDYIQGHYALAFVLEQKMQYEEALQHWEEIKRVNPEYPEIDQAEKILRLKTTEQLLTQAREASTSNPDEAIKLYEKAQTMAPEVSQIPLEISIIQLRTGSCNDALQNLEKSGETLPDDPEIQYSYGECLSESEEYDKALAAYEKAQQLKPDPNTEERIVETKNSIAFRTMPQEYQNIGQTPEINRAQLAALIFTNLKFLQKYGASNSVIIVDVFDHWAKNYIQKAVDTGMMEVFPNRTFQPYRQISKIELARAAARILEILETNEGKKISTTQNSDLSVADVPDGNIYHAMVMKTLLAGVLSLDTDGRFHLNRPVSGAEAQSVVNRLQVLSE